MDIVFSGKVLPERAYVTISGTPPLEFDCVDCTDKQFKLRITTYIQCAQVAAKVEIIEGTIDLLTLKNIIASHVKALVDAYGYTLGRGYDVEITSALEPDGQYTVFGVGVDQIEEAHSERPLQFSELWLVVIKSPHLRAALGDLREAIRSPSDTGFFSYRAVECLRQYFMEHGCGSDKASWKQLRNHLRVDAAYINEIKKHADAARHGKLVNVSGDDRIYVMKLSWKVVDRFSVYVHTDYGPLPEKDYPMLQLP